jgi:hypothetical protein
VIAVVTRALVGVGSGGRGSNDAGNTMTPGDLDGNNRYDARRVDYNGSGARRDNNSSSSSSNNNNNNNGNIVWATPIPSSNGTRHDNSSSTHSNSSSTNMWRTSSCSSSSNSDVSASCNGDDASLNGDNGFSDRRDDYNGMGDAH